MSVPAPVASPRLYVGPACDRCGQAAQVQWQRRLTQAELDTEVARVNTLRAEKLAEQDPENPIVFGPLPTLADSTRAVFACGPHAIDQESAGLIHQATCTGPHGDQQPHPKCTCTPEPAKPREATPAPELPAHWT